jgi:hypothetical protein
MYPPKGKHKIQSELTFLGVQAIASASSSSASASAFKKPTKKLVKFNIQDQKSGPFAMEDSLSEGATSTTTEYGSDEIHERLDQDMMMVNNAEKTWKKRKLLHLQLAGKYLNEAHESQLAAVTHVDDISFERYISQCSDCLLAVDSHLDACLDEDIDV